MPTRSSPIGCCAILHLPIHTGTRMTYTRSPCPELLGVSFGRVLLDIECVFVTLHTRTWDEAGTTSTRQTQLPILVDLDMLWELHDVLPAYCWELDPSYDFKDVDGPVPRWDAGEEPTPEGGFLFCTSLSLDNPTSPFGALVLRGASTNLGDMEFLLVCDLSHRVALELRQAIALLIEAVGREPSEQSDEDEDEEEEGELPPHLAAEIAPLVEQLGQEVFAAFDRLLQSRVEEAMTRLSDDEAAAAAAVTDQVAPLMGRTFGMQVELQRLAPEVACAQVRIVTGKVGSPGDPPGAIDLLLPLPIVEQLAELMPSTAKRLRELDLRNDEAEGKATRH